MNSKGHVILILIKFILRVSGGAVIIARNDYVLGVIMLIIAESIGTTEELMDATSELVDTIVEGR